MAKASAVGSGPIAYYGADGTRTLVQISDLFFENGIIKAKKTLSSDVMDWIRYLVKRGDITEGSIASPVEALLAEAKHEGSGGNRIEIRIEATTDPQKVTITAWQIDRYERMTYADLKARLGSSTTAGTEPGLFRVKGAFAAGLPPPALGAQTMKPDARPYCELAKQGGNVVALEARESGTNLDEGDFTVEIADLDATANPPVFTLITKWEHAVPNVRTGEFTTKLKKLGYIVTFEEPDGGWKVPRADQIRLGGGDEAHDASSATGTILADG